MNGEKVAVGARSNQPIRASAGMGCPAPSRRGALVIIAFITMQAAQPSWQGSEGKALA